MIEAARPWICTRCTNVLARRIRPLRNTGDFSRQRTAYTAKVQAQDGRPFRMAVIGSGPAGFYTAYKVMSKIENSVVDMYEHLPVPFGLVRFGVAPDHPEVKVDLPLGEITIMMLRMRFRTARINSKK
jgi:adrenodoxin-NADP+ reductase